MVGFALALAGGAAKGWGAGQLQAIKATREEKLRQLELDRAERIESNRQEFTAAENALTREAQERQTNAQLAATERNTNAQLGVQERLGNLGATVDRERIAAQKEISGNELKNRLDLQHLTGEQSQLLHTKPVKYTNEAGDEIVRLERPDGTALPNPVDDDGNELTFAITADDTDDVKNMKYLTALGVDQEKAMSTIFEAKNANRELAQAGILKSIQEGMSTFKNLDEEDIDFAHKKAKQIVDDMYGPEEGGAVNTAPSSATEPPAAEKPEATTSPDLKFPEGTTQEQAAAWAKAQIKKGKSRQAIKQVLKANNIDPAAAGL